MSIAKRVCEERKWELGGLVGYKVGLSSHCSEDTRLTYCTTGVLLHRLVNQRSLNDFTHIIIDEVHERDQDMDFLLLVVRKLLRTNSHSVRVILMSATINVDKFSKYFSIYVGKKKTPAPIIDVIKKNMYVVRDFYLEDLSGISEQPEVSIREPTISQKMYAVAKKLILMLDQVDYSLNTPKEEILDLPTVLVFLPGIYEIEDMHRALINANYPDWEIIILHSLITNSEQARIFENTRPGIRRIILSTNIAESSLTVPNVKYVVDFCLIKQLITDSQTNFQCLDLVWASRANCQQRAGRTGRVMDGRVYRLIPKKMYEQDLLEENPPEILRAPLTNVFLKAKMLNMDKPKALLALSLDPPDLTNLCRSVVILKETGALFTPEKDNDPFDGEITDLGKVMAELPVDVHISKLIVLGNLFSVLQDAIVMGASMAVKNMFSTKFQKKIPTYNAKLYWAQNTSSDAIAFNNAYRVWISKKANLNIKSNDEEVAWARRNYLEIRVLREVDVLVREITGRLEKFGIKETYGADKVTWTSDRKLFILKIITTGAFYPHYYKTQQMHDEKDCVKLIGGLEPTKSVYLTGWAHKQPGMLYAKRIQQCFESCKSSKIDKIAVKFDNSNRVFIQFGNTLQSNDNKINYDKNGEIPIAIYQAIKMRSIRGDIEVPVMELNESLKAADDRNIGTISVFDLPCDNVSLLTATTSRYNEIRPKLPSLDITHIPLEIKNIINPGSFWACLNDIETKINYETINNYLESMPEEKFLLFEKQPYPGSFVLGPFDEKEGKIIYNRALLQSVSKNFVTIFFIDYGKIKQIPLSDLRRLPPNNKISKIPAQVFQCSLTNIKPSTINSITGEWSEEAKEDFKNIINNKKELYGKVYSVVDGVVSINLIYSDYDKKTTDVNDYLIREGHAEYREESFLSKKNHELREKRSGMTATNKARCEEQQYSQLYLADTYVEPPAINDCTRMVKLKGPFSPLEVKLYDMTNIGMGMTVKIHESSVNSVLLDSSIEEPQPRLLVAGNVSQSTSSNALTLRNTTLLPNIPGLVGLLVMIFAQKIELRCNSLRTRNIGVLCGLGYGNDKKSLFPEHDMYVDFDVDITIDDMQNINRLRYWMSLGVLFDTNTDANDADMNERMLKIQNSVHDVFFKIMDTKRDPVQREIDLRHNQWCRYKNSMYTQPKHLNNYTRMTFKPHCALNLDLNDKDPNFESMILHLNELKLLVSESAKDHSNRLVECKLCRIEVFGLTELRKHVFSIGHRQLEAKSGALK